MFFSSSKKDGGRVIGIIDIGSAQISGAIVKLTKNREIESVLAQVDEKITYQELPEFTHFWESTRKAIKIVLEKLRKETGADPEKIFVFLSSPFFQSQTKVIKSSNNTTKITKDYLANLVKQVNEDYRLNENVIILEDKIIQTKLDGYLTTWPIGQKAKEITLNYFLSWADKSLLVELRDLLRTSYARAPVIFNTFSFAIYNIFKNFLPDKDFILLDTGNELTDLLIIKDNVLVEHFSFPYGKNYLIRDLAQKLKTIPAEAESTLNLYALGQTNAQLTTRLEKALSASSPAWQNSFKQALTQALNTTFLPETIYLIGDEATDNIFVNFIDQTDLSSLTISNHKLTAVFIEKFLADGLKQLTGRDTLLTNSWLLAEALFCARIKENY